MNNDKIKEFQYRITQANRSALVVITLDIALEHIREALKSAEAMKESEDSYNTKSTAYDSYQNNLKMAKRTIDTLVTSLDMSGILDEDSVEEASSYWDISNMSVQLYNLYSVWQRILLKAKVGCNKENVESICRLEGMILKLRDAFSQAAQTDDSMPLMNNTHQVYAGLTYSRAGGSNESFTVSANRGYMA